MYKPESEAEHESEQPSNEERELERLFADDLGVERLPSPPEGLADRIKAEIPADLGWKAGEQTVNDEADDGDSGSAGVVVPFYRQRGFLAMAATLMLAVALWTLVPRTEMGVGEDGEDQAPLTHPSSAEVSASSADESSDVGAGEIDARQTRGESVEAPLAEKAPAEQRDLGYVEPQRHVQARREALEKKQRSLMEELQQAPKEDADGGRADDAAARARSRRVPMPDATPDEAEPANDIQALESEIVFGIPEPAAAPSPPPPPLARRPVPPPMSAQAGQGNNQIEASNERIASLQEEARKLEREMKELDDESATAGALNQAPPHTLQPPNDEAYDAMYFDSAGVNPFVDTEDDALSTFGFDVDTASYTVVRRYLQDGNLPPHDAVRVEEMLNFFDYGDQPPSEDEVAEGEFALHADVAPSPWAPGGNRSERYYLVRFGLKARDVLATERPPALLTFVVDVSGSMARENRLGLVKRSLGLLLDNLQEGDEVALVVYGSRGRVLLEPTASHDAVREAIGRLHSEGSTNAAEGLRLAYELTARHREPGRIHRVILCSDGVANVGSTTSGEGILGEVKRWGRQGVELTTVGFGMGNYNDTLMETLADQGNGRYAYVDTLDEARRIFVDDLTGTLTTVAAEARAQVEFDADVVSRYRLLGYENRDIADERFRDDTVDAGEIGAGHAVTALYEVKTKRPLKKRDRLATITLRYASIARGEMVEQSRTVTGRDAAPSFGEAPRALRLAATVAEFAEVLRGSYWARDVDLGEVFAEAQKVSAEWPGDADVAEFASLVGKAKRLHERE